MEDLTSILTVATDLNELNCRDEEEYTDSALELETEIGESRESFLSESIFCSGVLSALPLTQAVWGRAILIGFHYGIQYYWLLVFSKSAVLRPPSVAVQSANSHTQYEHQFKMKTMNDGVSHAKPHSLGNLWDKNIEFGKKSKIRNRECSLSIRQFLKKHANCNTIRLFNSVRKPNLNLHGFRGPHLYQIDSGS